MFKRGLMAAVAAASMVATPVLAQSSASKLSVASSVRANAAAKGENLFGGGALIGVLVFAAVVGVIYAVAEGNDESVSA
ncbi:hypothetical protein GON01_15420 [Sphingomonas sp. MAH-20]|jgi:hypothetical protein|uniref:Uncharacterized protein n=1 Tax=Sphingomonas horti TaxID=2682842 RepID=A0A6I4J3K3_9SPHN|nr:MULTISPECIES: hypothetical protein [Sphingomonas]MBA2919289.1 hypothetical protein [Sphingomonas sp. CGMCC 1.13658]MVO79322.1 hypothetical protein [Sphingomonas horti]